MAGVAIYATTRGPRHEEIRRARRVTSDRDRRACGHSFSESSISSINESLDEGLKAFRRLRHHEGSKAAIREVLPEAGWQRCYAYFLGNALDYVRHKVDDDCLQEVLALGLGDGRPLPSMGARPVAPAPA